MEKVACYCCLYQNPFWCSIWLNWHECYMCVSEALKHIVCSSDSVAVVVILIFLYADSHDWKFNVFDEYLWSKTKSICIRYNKNVLKHYYWYMYFAYLSDWESFFLPTRVRVNCEIYYKKKQKIQYDFTKETSCHFFKVKMKMCLFAVVRLY